MPNLWVSDADLKSKLKDVLQKATFEAVTSWDSIISDSNLSAYNYIVSALLRRGYTMDQIDAWDSRTTYEIDIGLYWSLVKGGCTKDFDETFINALDRRLELLDLELVIGGEIVVPPVLPLGGGGSVQSGTMKNDNDLFCPPTPRRRWPNRR
jgi:hypothetical protein